METEWQIVMIVETRIETAAVELRHHDSEFLHPQRQNRWEDIKG